MVPGVTRKLHYIIKRRRQQQTCRSVVVDVVVLDAGARNKNT